MIIMNEKKSCLTLRSFAIGLTGLVFVTVLSMYVALKMGALPWPTVFVTVFSAVCLRKRKNVTLQEISCTHTLMSAGSMVAGGLAFTLPGFWMMNSGSEMSFISVCVISVVGAVLGTIFISLNRKTFIEEQKLPYPIGCSAYNTLVAAVEGKGAKTMFSSIGFSAVFSYLRDGLSLFPSNYTLLSAGAFLPSLSLYLSPMALGIGAIIGTVLSFVWFLGMLSGYFVIIPVGLNLGWFSDMVAADRFRSNLGIGLMVGTGLGVVIKAGFSLLRNIISGNKSKIRLKNLLYPAAACILCSVMLTVFTEMTLIQSLILIPGIYLSSYLAGMLTGQTGINPMEILAILVLLFISALTGTTLGSAFAIAGCVAVCAGISGDVMNDLKSGFLVGTSAKDQIISEAVGGIIGAIIATFVLFVLKTNYVLGATEFPAPQAKAVSSMVQGLSNPISFWIGLSVGVVLFLFKLPSATLGLGVYLPTGITMSVTVGSLFVFLSKQIFKRRNISDTVNLISSGFLGGEGLAGVVIALISVFGV